MGAITETLNKLGYGEQNGDSSTRVSVVVNMDENQTDHQQPESPRGYVTNGECAGCELSARYF
jgi:hypothetical protein